MFPGHDALVSFDHVLLNVAVAVAAQGGVEQKYMLVFKVELLVCGISSINQSVDHGEEQLKLAKGRLDSCKGRVVETGAISSAVAPQD